MIEAIAKPFLRPNYWQVGTLTPAPYDTLSFSIDCPLS